MLIGLDEQQLARILEDVFQSIRGKTYENSGACHVGKVFKDPGIRGMSGNPLQSKRQIIASFN